MGEFHELESTPGLPIVRASSVIRCETVSAPEVHQRYRNKASAQASMVRLVMRRLTVAVSVFFVLFSAIIAPWPVTRPALAQALNSPNPPLSVPASMKPTGPGTHPNLNKSARPTAPSQTSVGEPTRHPWPVSMKPAKLALSPAAQHFVSSDGLLTVDIPAQSLDATQLAASPGGLFLFITQVKAGGGSTSGGLIAFGTYEFQFFDGAGKPANTVRVLHPFTVQLHLPKDQQLVWNGQTVYALWTAVQGAPTPPAIPSSTSDTGKLTGFVPPAMPHQSSTLLYAQGSNQNMDWSIQSSFGTAQGTHQMASNSDKADRTDGVLAMQASTVGFNTQAPQASWGKPTDSQVDLNSGGLTTAIRSPCHLDQVVSNLRLH